MLAWKQMNRVAVILTASVLAAACVEERSAAQSQGEAPSPTATAETGSVFVLVTTPEMQPLAEVQVLVVQLDRMQLTDASGEAQFHALEPSSYSVVAAKSGYRPLQPQGRVVEVVAGETSTLKLQLDQVLVVNENNSYHRVLPFKGFIACSADWGQTGPNVGKSQCGKGLNVAGNNIGADPNDSTAHKWAVENALLQSIIMEAEWSPSFPTLGSALYFSAQWAWTCSAQSCQYDEMGGKGGTSPLRVVVEDGSAKNISSRYAPEAKYPVDAWSIGRTYRSAAQPAITFQQAYNLVVAPFYGAPAPVDWSSKAPA